MNSDKSAIASLLSALVWFPLGMIVGALAVRERERVKTEEIAYSAQMGELGAGPPAPPAPEGGMDPIELHCDLCDNHFSVPPDTFGEVPCPNCNNAVEV